MAYPAHVPPASFPDDPAGAVAEWSERVLTVPPGHPLAGSPMKLPGYGVDFLRDVFSHRESLLCMARKTFQEWHRGDLPYWRDLWDP